MAATSPKRCINPLLSLLLKVVGCHPDFTNGIGFSLAFVWGCMLVLPFEIWFSIEHMNDIDKLMECFGILTGILGYGSKLLMLRLSWRSVSSLVQIIISDYETTREPALRAALLKNYKLGTGVTKLLFGTYMSLAFFIPMENCIRIARNGYTPSLLYSIPTSYPMIKKTAKNHIMVNFVQLTQVIVAGSGHALCDVFFTVLVIIA
uniref:Uncharacterized protein n=1 Tax=Trichogramma kaykai TaxID=54128 RepID=A0ABD2VYN3_9HYME